MAAAVVKALDTKAPFKAVTLKYKAKKYLGVSDFPELRGEVGLLVLSSSFLLSPSPPLILFSPLPELRGEVGPLFSSSSLLLSSLLLSPGSWARWAPSPSFSSSRSFHHRAFRSLIKWACCFPPFN